MGIRGFATKKALRLAVKEHGSVSTSCLVETSIFGQECKVGDHCIVGPTPEKRSWFASITIKEGLDGLAIVKVA